jgi:hypothetical protein
MSSPIHVLGRVRRVGNSLALLIPAQEARRAGLEPGDAVDAELRPRPTGAYGLLKGILPYERFSREGLYRDD